MEEVVQNTGAGQGWRPSRRARNQLPPIFPSETVGRVNPAKLINWHFLPTLETALLQWIRFYDLLQTFGSLLIQAGSPIVCVRDQMGHASIKITVDT